MQRRQIAQFAGISCAASWGRWMEKRQGHPQFYELLEELEPRFLEKFRELVAEMADTHDRKNANYAADGDPLSNLTACARVKVPPAMGVFIRLQDKWSRITELMKGKDDL